MIQLNGKLVGAIEFGDLTGSDLHHGIPVWPKPISLRVAAVGVARNRHHWKDLHLLQEPNFPDSTLVMIQVEAIKNRFYEGIHVQRVASP